jgi:hypothetical protein
MHLRRGVSPKFFLLRNTFPHQRCYSSITRAPSVPVACSCIPRAPPARLPAPCSAACRTHCAKSRPLGETITDPVSQPHYASCLASPSRQITKAQIKPGHALGSPLYRALCAATKTPENLGRAARNFQQNRDRSGKQSQILYRNPIMQAVLPAFQGGSRRPRSSPATPSTAPCTARGSDKRRASRGSRGPAPLQLGNFQDLTRVDCAEFS